MFEGIVTDGLVEPIVGKESARWIWNVSTASIEGPMVGPVGKMGITLPSKSHGVEIMIKWMVMILDEICR